MLLVIQILKFVSEMVAHELMDYNLPKAHRQEGEQADDELCLHGEPDLRGRVDHPEEKYSWCPRRKPFSVFDLDDPNPMPN